MRKKGDAEILGSILIITLVVLIGAMVFVYSKNSIKETLQSTDKLGADQRCSNIMLKVSDCRCPTQTQNNEGICSFSIVNDAPAQINEIIYSLYQDNYMLNTSRLSINLPSLGGYLVNNIIIPQNTFPTKIELKPTKVIFNNQEINCGSKISMGGC